MQPNITIVHRRAPLVLSLLCCVLLAAGCTAKAKAVQLGAAEFEASSLAVVDSIDTMRQRETAYVAFTDAEREDYFVAGATTPEGDYSFEQLLEDAQPEIVLGADVDGAWKAYLGQLRRDYTMFAAVFTNLDRGSLFASGIVDDAVPVLDQLLGQIAAVGQAVRDHPPRFLSARVELTERVREIAANTSFDADAKRELLLVERERVLALAGREHALAREVQERVAKALTVGLALRQQLLEYDKLSMADITEALATSIGIAGTLTGADLASLQKKVDGYIAVVNDDPDLRAAFDVALEKINRSRT